MIALPFFSVNWKPVFFSMFSSYARVYGRIEFEDSRVEKPTSIRPNITALVRRPPRGGNKKCGRHAGSRIRSIAETFEEVCFQRALLPVWNKRPRGGVPGPRTHLGPQAMEFNQIFEEAFEIIFKVGNRDVRSSSLKIASDCKGQTTLRIETPGRHLKGLRKLFLKFWRISCLS